MVSPMRLALVCCAALLGGLACDSSDAGAAGIGEDSFQDDDIPMGGCDATECPPSGAGATAPVGSSCDAANHCQSGVCAASFEDSEPGELVCQLECIGPMDTTMWCSDSATCCGNAVCSPRGFCVPSDPEVGDDESSSGSTDGGSTGGSTTGGADGTSGSDSGDGGSTGSDSTG